ncbi:type III-A CRISPR-associated RAMP protein Csm3 [Desulfurobacterium sp.]|uniref:type III-A CRISPR-associated RAMP protein Csm3 n=1 Tax=Desulfurobacterium sp. TaxID=2004706 RepID=UPI00260DCCA1|nr:type III-A CRISPR-associated RAMP protein Csm3 [Desulfurobacterium sp.]
MKLKNIKEISGKIKLITGLHIGAGETEIHIGGTDNPVVKHPFTNEPYIPGSSLKGKIRSLLELKSGLIKYSKQLNKDGEPLSMEIIKKAKENNENKDRIEYGLKIIKLFGTSGAEENAKKMLGPTRVSFSDCMITEEMREKAQKGEIVLTEIKAENRINRITGTAQHPRFTERVPAGIEFNFCITLKEFEGDEGLEELLLEGMKLLEHDALGGSGSRGYGRIKFEFNDSEIQERYNKINPFKPV